MTWRFLFVHPCLICPYFFFVYIRTSLVIGRTFFPHATARANQWDRWAIGRPRSFLAAWLPIAISIFPDWKQLLARLFCAVSSFVFPPRSAEVSAEVTGNQRPWFDDLTEQVAKPAELDLQKRQDSNFSREREREEERGGEEGEVRWAEEGKGGRVILEISRISICAE